MNCVLTRKEFRPDGIFGEFSDESGQQIAVTLEHAYPDGDSFVPKVALGTYTCVRHPPTRLPYETFMLEDVPDFQGQPVSGILIHKGNFNKDSSGCLLLGESVDTNGPDGAQMILHSATTFLKFMQMQQGVDSFQLIVTA